jgi:hypothetical protein
LTQASVRAADAAARDATGEKISGSKRKDVEARVRDWLSAHPDFRLPGNPARNN